jgi:glycosyltransferase involved in cell wall biosynthesis
MRILHLLSNRKWTETSEPVVDLALGQRKLGHDVTLICGKWRPGTNRESSVEEQARLKGLEPVVMNMDKHFRVMSICKDIPRLHGLLDREKPDVIHAHKDNAHLEAALAVFRRADRPLLVKSSYEVEGPARGFRSSILLRKFSDGLITICEEARNKAIQRFRIPSHRTEVIEPGIEWERFDPGRSLQHDRIEFGLNPSHFVVGLVSRIRSDRRVDIPIRTVHLLASRLPNLRLLLIGHGEGRQDMEALIRELDIEDRVLWGGYCRGDRLVAAYRAMDVLVYPAPGTDQSCRTVREAMASGRPVVAPRTGFLSELIDDKRTGRFMDGAPENLADILQKLHQDTEGLNALKKACLSTAKERFSLEMQATKTIGFYERILAARA